MTNEIPRGTTVTFNMRGYRPSRYGSTKVTGRLCRLSADGQAYIVQITGPDRKDWGVMIGEYVRVDKDNIEPVS